MWCCALRKATRTSLRPVHSRFKTIKLQNYQKQRSETVKVIGENRDLKGWKCLMASTEILEAIDPASHSATFERSQFLTNPFELEQYCQKQKYLYLTTAQEGGEFRWSQV